MVEHTEVNKIRRAETLASIFSELLNKMLVPGRKTKVIKETEEMGGRSSVY